MVVARLGELGLAFRFIGIPHRCYRGLGISVKFEKRLLGNADLMRDESCRYGGVLELEVVGLCLLCACFAFALGVAERKS